MFDRRQFLVGLFGTVAVAAAGPIPAALEAMPEERFKSIFEQLKENTRHMPEIYANRLTGEYSFTALPGFTPLREESDRIATTVLQRLYKEYSHGL